MIYGYCRISTQSQNIERQVRNILAAYPNAEIIREVYTGTTFQGRDKLEKLLKKFNSNFYPKPFFDKLRLSQSCSKAALKI